MKSVELAEIQATVARKVSITTDQMLSRTRNQAVIFACQIAMYIARMHTTKSLPEIAASFNKTHAAVLYGITTIKKRLEVEPNIASTLSGILYTAIGNSRLYAYATLAYWGYDRNWEVHVLAFFCLFARGEAFAGKSAICLDGP